MTFVFFILSYLDVPWVSVMGQSVFHWVLTTKIIHVYLEGDTVLLLDEKLPETAWIAHKGTVVTGMNHWWCSFWTVLQRGKVTWRGKRSMGKKSTTVRDTHAPARWSDSPFLPYTSEVVSLTHLAFILTPAKPLLWSHFSSAAAQQNLELPWHVQAQLRMQLTGAASPFGNP